MWTIWIDVKLLVVGFIAGGSSTIASLLPTKTLAFGGDIWPDQPDVPAYLVYFSTWQRAKPRTLLTNLFVTCFSTICYMYSTRLSQSGHVFAGLHIQSELRFKLAHLGIWHFFVSIFGSWYLIPTGDLSICRMSTEHQLMSLFFHWTLDGLGLLFWGRCHDRCIPQQNSKNCFSSSVRVCACLCVCVSMCQPARTSNQHFVVPEGLHSTGVKWPGLMKRSGHTPAQYMSKHFFKFIQYICFSSFFVPVSHTEGWFNQTIACQNFS